MSNNALWAASMRTSVARFPLEFERFVVPSHLARRMTLHFTRARTALFGSFLAVAVGPLAVSGCGSDGSSAAGGSDADSGNGSSVSPDDTSGAAMGPDVVVSQPLAWPIGSNVLPCERRNQAADSGADTTTVYDYDAIAGVVTVTKQNAGGDIVETYRYEGVDENETCSVPPEELLYGFVDIVGCPDVSRSDIDGDGITDTTDRRLRYRYGPDGRLEAIEIFTSRDAATGRSLEFDYSADAIVVEERTSDGLEGTIRFVPDNPTRWNVEADFDGDGMIDETRVFVFDDEERLVRSERATRDVVSGEFRPPTVSTIAYTCDES